MDVTHSMTGCHTRPSPRAVPLRDAQIHKSCPPRGVLVVTVTNQCPNCHSCRPQMLFWGDTGKDRGMLGDTSLSFCLVHPWSMVTLAWSLWHNPLMVPVTLLVPCGSTGPRHPASLHHPAGPCHPAAPQHPPGPCHRAGSLSPYWFLSPQGCSSLLVLHSA